MVKKNAIYDESSIKSLDWREHIRSRPGMYVGKLGDGSDGPSDGIYVLLKEVLDNSIDEFRMGEGSRVEIELTNDSVKIRDYGRGIPQGKLVDCLSKINTGGKYSSSSSAFQKSIGLNGVGIKAVNALSEALVASSFRNGVRKTVEFKRGVLTKDHPTKKTKQPNGTEIEFFPDKDIFIGSSNEGLRFMPEHVVDLLKHYAYLNTGLTLILNGEEFLFENGLLDLLTDKTAGIKRRYAPLHFISEDGDIEVALTHGDSAAEQYYSFVNGQYTPQAGTHQAAFREAIVKAAREHFKKSFDAQDVRSGLIASICIRIQEPIFESQTKTKLGSIHREPKGVTIRSWVNDVVSNRLDRLLHENSDAAAGMLEKINQAEFERKELDGVKKIAKERSKKANFCNKKLRDCRQHFNTSNKLGELSTIFLTEGDSAAGSMTKARDPRYQAVFALRGKPLNCFGLRKKIVYENEEFSFLQHAIQLEKGADSIRFNKIVLATDADVDGMHIRNLLLTFFLQFYPDVVQNGHVYILSTPLFRVRDKKQTIYCYSESEKQQAMKKIGPSAEITRFKGLGEISPDEFGDFIGEDIKLEQVGYPDKPAELDEILQFYMGKNTPERKTYVIENLKSDDLEGV